MPWGVRVVVAAALAAVSLGGAGPVGAGEPPNQNDPCSAGGRNTCGTNGVGVYETYRYGLRWFGDFRGAVPGARQTFCIDLQYWYPSAAYRFREDPSGTLRNRDGETVSLESRRRLAYAIWTFGRTNDPQRQAAVMLYVHALMGDARPGEVDPAALGAAVERIYATVARDSARYHGPYRVVVDAPDRLTVGAEGTATIRVLASGGAAVPGVRLTLAASGAAGLPAAVTTNASGIARVELRAASAEGIRLDARSEALASTLPAIWAPSTRAAARNGQRLAVPESQVVRGSASVTVAKARVVVSSAASPAELVAGGESRDRVTIRGAGPSFRVTVTALLHGPFRSVGAIRCDGEPAWRGTWRTNGSGDYTTPAVRLERPGWYVYQQLVPDDQNHVGATTPCTDARERVKVVAAPRVRTIVSEQRAAAGSEIYDRVIVEGLAGEPATIQAALYGPFPTREALRCTGTPFWSGTVEAAGDGEYRTAPVRLNVPGFYTYRETLAAGEFVRAAETRCGEEAETTIVPGTPRVRTQVSAQQTRPGARITDRVVVEGIGVLAVPVRVELFGPFATQGGISCEGRPVWSGTVNATGDGTYTTGPVVIERVGWYTFREAIVESPQSAGFTGRCGEASETTVARAAPTVTTVVSSEVVVPGASIFDRVRVQGLGRSEARIEVELFGPFPTRGAIRCTGAPYWRGTVTARGDGTLRTPSVRLARVGFYTYRERLAGSDLIAAVTTECALVPETALARPLVLTGRNERAAARRPAAVPSLAPARVRVASQAIDAPVFPVGISIGEGALAVPSPIARLGWWVDGMPLGERAGAVLIAGHVDSARAGPGAFFRLRAVQRGDRVQVTARNGRVFTYRVTSVQTMPKESLPTSVYSRAGRARLVLVTCGGPFDPGTGRYRDNVVVTAVPG